MLNGTGEGHRRLVSVIVPVRDDAAGIRSLLSCLEAQTLPRDAFEVVIGDDGSQEPLFGEMAMEGSWLRIERGPPQTSYAARNRAARAARGAVLAFCDSDCRPEPDWLEQGLLALESADVVAGEVTFVAPEPPTVWSLLTIDMYLDQARNVRLARAVTANLFVRRRVFDDLGGFDESLPSGGDYDFARRSVQALARLAYAPTAVVRHPTLDTRDRFLRKIRQTTYWAMVRRVRAGERATVASVFYVIPIIGVALARRRALQPLVSLPRARLEAAGVRPGRWQHLDALLTFYVVVGPVGAYAKVRGWLDGRRFERRRAERLGSPPGGAVASGSESSRP